MHNLGRPPRRLVFLHLDARSTGCPGTVRRSPSTTARSASSPAAPATTTWGRWRWPWSAATPGRGRAAGRRRGRGAEVVVDPRPGCTYAHAADQG
ncbi:hypothetical protein [Actinopolymorpha cephalotaxi]|uniref:hypothetical protein n=1 Tax=Actinopolymorpha cephalotaxi TaxID=504797 RepID=UPI00364144BD